MKAFLAGLVISILLAVATAVVLQSLNPSSGDAYSTSNVRLGD